MSGGTVRGNILSGGNNYGKEALVNGAFKMSGNAQPERVFLVNNSYNTAYSFITISGPLSGGLTVIDLGITGSAPLTSWIDKPILVLDGSYSSGNLASLKEHFTLGNTTLTESPYTETPIPTNYTIDNDGKLKFPSSGISDITYNGTWTLESDGRRKSPAIGYNDVTKERISFTSAVADANITVRLDVSSNENYDYAFISTLDNGSAAYNSGYFTGSRISGEAWTTVSIPVPDAGSHFIDIGYWKDGWGSDGSDCAWFKVGE
jgi:hypothetical protein